DPFADWPAGRKPDLVLVLSGEMRGYLQPCGCSRPQLGGLERRYNFIKGLRDRGWPVVPLDLGDVASTKGKLHEQHVLKYKVAMQALEKIGYAAVGVGKQEFSVPLLNALSEFTLQNPDKPPFVLAQNVMDREKNYPPGGGKRPSMVSGWELVNAGGLKVGVGGLVGRDLAKEVSESIDRGVRFEGGITAVRSMLTEMGPQKPDFRVMLYHGEHKDAVMFASFFP